MTDAIPQVTLGLGANTQTVVMIGEKDQEATDLAGLFVIAPELKQPEAAEAAARAVNHLAQGAAFEVILDPASFADTYKARLAAEDPDAPWSPGVVRLHDYGIPDFDEIQSPTITGTQLIFFAEDSYLGVPYRVEVDLGAPGVVVTEASYRVMDFTPIERPDDPDMIDADEDDYVPGDDDD